LREAVPITGNKPAKIRLESTGTGVFNAAFILLPSSLLFATPGRVLRASYRRSHTNHRLAATAKLRVLFPFNVVGCPIAADYTTEQNKEQQTKN
jgi:hypothetical protein